MTEQAKPAGTATMTIGDKSVELPVLGGSTGPNVVDIRKLYGATGAFTYDPGFTSTASCESSLTYIDGDEGVLLHRGYPIDQLAEKSNFVEVCHLLLRGELPTAAQYEAFEDSVTRHTMLHSQFDRFFEGFRRDAHPMAIMVGVQDEDAVHGPHQRRVDLIILGRNGEAHAPEVLGVAEVVARRHEGLADVVLVGPRGDGRHLGDQTNGRDVALDRIMDVQAVVIEG